jgi:hypothetical protein
MSKYCRDGCLTLHKNVATKLLIGGAAVVGAGHGARDILLLLLLLLLCRCCCCPAKALATYSLLSPSLAHNTPSISNITAFVAFVTVPGEARSALHGSAENGRTPRGSPPCCSICACIVYELR